MPFLHDIYGATLATVHLAVREDDHVLYLETLRGSREVADVRSGRTEEDERFFLGNVVPRLPLLAEDTADLERRLTPAAIHDRVQTMRDAMRTPAGGIAGKFFVADPLGLSEGLLATASYDRTVRLWNVADPTRPKPLGKPLTGHTSWVSTAIFSPDGAHRADGEARFAADDAAGPARLAAALLARAPSAIAVHFSGP